MRPNPASLDQLRHPVHTGHLTVGALKRHRDRPVLYLGDTTLTGGQLADRISQYIQAFESLGAGTDATVGLLSLNRPEVLMIIGAGQTQGYRRTALHPLGSLDDHAYVLADAGATSLIIDPNPMFVQRAVDLLAKVPLKDRIVFAPANPKYTVAVFTDIECGFCRQLHSQIAEYNREGIAVEYLAFPRAGINTPDYDKMVAVWCAPDRKKALTDAKSDKPVPAPPAGCVSPVKDEYITGIRAGLNGTPMILTLDGHQLGGYLPPDALLERLDALAKDKKAG